MLAHFSFSNKNYEADLSSFFDISIPLRPNHENPNCFYAPPPLSSPVRAGDFVGSIADGGPLNFKNLTLNPHGNGTHTECYAHIYPTDQTINKTFTQLLFPARLISVYPRLLENGDRIVDVDNLVALPNVLPTALIVRTLPNSHEKLQRNYSGTNPPYVSDEFLFEIRRRGVEHLLIDLPSVDREEDDGKLVGHKAFWGINDLIQTLNTITELIYVPTLIKDGLYLLQFSICPLELDASPSKPVIYTVKELPL